METAEEIEAHLERCALRALAELDPDEPIPFVITAAGIRALEP